jgi:hypothetical protein
MSNPPIPDTTYVPSTDQVRRSYDGTWDTSSPHGPAAAAEFNRWLADHDAQVELGVYERLKLGPATPYSFHPFLDKLIDQRKRLIEKSERERGKRG